MSSLHDSSVTPSSKSQNRNGWQLVNFYLKINKMFLYKEPGQIKHIIYCSFSGNHTEVKHQNQRQESVVGLRCELLSLKYTLIIYTCMPQRDNTAWDTFKLK